jgi:hypothetical protein
MRGRMRRLGQLAHTVVYRLVLLHTPDIILNNMSFTKEIMMRAFLGGEEAYDAYGQWVHS